MPQTEAQKAWRQAHRKENGQSYVRIDTMPETKAEWKAYAESQNLPMGTMIRQCIARCMELDGWTYKATDENENK